MWQIEAAELDRITTACDAVGDPELSLYVRVLYATGLDHPDAAAIRWRDLDLERGTIAVHTEFGWGEFDLTDEMRALVARLEVGEPDDLVMRSGEVDDPDHGTSPLVRAYNGAFGGRPHPTSVRRMLTPPQRFLRPNDVQVDASGAAVTRACLDPWNYLEMSSTGQFRPCCVMPPVAMLQEPDGRDSAGMRDWRAALLEGRLGPSCERCTIRKTVPVGVLVH